MRRELLISSLLGLVIVGGVTTTSLQRNEGLRARLAWELMNSGNWFVPTLYGEPHLTKPPGMGLLIAACSWPVGRLNEFTARLPSILAALTTLALMYWTVRQTFDSEAGWATVMALACCPAWLDRVPSAEIDLVQLGWVAASMVFVLHAVESNRMTWWLLALLSVTGGFFTKWTAPLFFYLTVFPLLWWRGQLVLLIQRPHLLAATVAGTLVLAWLGWTIASVGAEALLKAVLSEALPRFSPSHHPKPYPWGELITFPLAFILICLPASVLVWPALRPSFADPLDARRRLLWQLAVVWLGSSLLFWTLAPGHRLRHLLPAQPAVALLAVMVWQRWPRLRHAPLLVLLVWSVVKLIWMGLVLPSREAQRDPIGQASLLSQLVPEEETLHLSQLKDECLLFYFDRPARRVTQFPHRPGMWCLLTQQEWDNHSEQFEWCAELRDSQNHPLILGQVRFSDRRVGASSPRAAKDTRK